MLCYEQRDRKFNEAFGVEDAARASTILERAGLAGGRDSLSMDSSQDSKGVL